MQELSDKTPKLAKWQVYIQAVFDMVAKCLPCSAMLCFDPERSGTNKQESLGS